MHVPFEGPGVFSRALERLDVRLELHLVPRDGLPDDPGDMLIVMGGPMSVNDPLPWIAEETAFIRTAIDSGMPVLGVCLGSQFMAKAKGATVRPGPAPEIGMTRIRLTPAGSRDPVFQTMPEAFHVFEWHGEVFDLPRGAVALARSDLCAIQSFRCGASSYGMLFHLEMERPGIEALCRECPEDVVRAKLTPSRILDEATSSLPTAHRWAEQLIQHLVKSAG